MKRDYRWHWLHKDILKTGTVGFVSLDIVVLAIVAVSLLCRNLMLGIIA